MLIIKIYVFRDSYTCRCPLNSIDQSSDSKRPGRKCFAQINECDNLQLNNCSRFADCLDKENGYECKCQNGYYDQNPENPGINCKFSKMFFFFFL